LTPSCREKSLRHSSRKAEVAYRGRSALQQCLATTDRGHLASAERVWELRANLSSYDAWYVAVAELADVPLATMDLRLARATGPQCEFLLPPG